MSKLTKKEKRKQKERLLNDSNEFSRKRMHFQEYQIPPYNQEHLKSLLLEYMAHDLFQYPIHHQDIMIKIKSLYRNDQNNDVYMKDLDLPAIITSLHSDECLKMNKRALGTKVVFIIDSINKKKIIEEAQKCFNLRPTVPPPDPITFQQQRKDQSKDQQLQKIVSQLSQCRSLLSGDTLLENHKEVHSFRDKIQMEEFKKKKPIEFCDYCTRIACQKAKGHPNCKQRHFIMLTTSNTDQTYGNCPHLNACHNQQCKLIHYLEEDYREETELERIIYKQRLEKAQWINCDMRYFDFNIVGKFDVVMADPPWDIHMSLPYGTMKDKEMLNLKVEILQDNGVIFLWVTGRAMELGRDCLTKWGYTYVDEIVWIKTNQINRLIITGKTGHWLNHTKQHCLVGIKGNPKINKHLDCDVIASRVRETSRKPDEIYAIIERMHPGGKKIQLFGRPDNCMPGWLTLGNQLTEVRLNDPQIISRYRQSYPQQDLSLEQMNRNLQEMINQDNRNKVYNNHIQKNTTL